MSAVFCTVVDATSQYVVRLGRVRSHQVSESAAGSSRGHDLVICWLEKLSEVKWRKQSEDVTGCDDGVWNPLTWHDVAWGCDGLKSDVCRGDEKVSPEQENVSDDVSVVLRIVDMKLDRVPEEVE